MERFRAGDDLALRQAFDRYAGMVQRVGMLRLGNHHDAEELVQQVFVRAWKGRAGFDPARGSLGAWLLGIARRLIADRYASLDRDRKVIAAAESIAPPATDVKSVDRVVDRVVVGDEVNRLPDEQRMVLRLAFYGDLSSLRDRRDHGYSDRDCQESHPAGAHSATKALGGGRCHILMLTTSRYSPSARAWAVPSTPTSPVAPRARPRSSPSGRRSTSPT